MRTTVTLPRALSCLSALVVAVSVAACSSGEGNGPVGDRTTTSPAPTGEGPAPVEDHPAAPPVASPPVATPPATSSPGTGTVTSNLFTGSYVVKDALVVIEKRPSTSTPNTFVEELTIYMVDKADAGSLCSYLQRSERPAGARRLEIEIEKRAASPAGAAISPGTYPLFSKATTNPTVESDLEGETYTRNEAGGCSTPDFLDLEGHTATQIVKNDLVLASVSDAGVKGTFELRFDDGKFIQGAFDAPACDVSGAPTTTTVCK